MKRKIILFILAICFLIIAGCSNLESGEKDTNINTDESSYYPVKIMDSREVEVTLDKDIKSIISLGPNITETIFALGAGDLLIGRTDYCDYPEEVLNVEKIGSLREPNIEKIISLNPDLVIASTHYNEDVIKKLETVGIKVLVLYSSEDFEGVYSLIGDVGKALNKENEADDLINSMKDKVKYVLEKVKDTDKKTVYYVVSYGKFGEYTAGGDTFIGKLIEMAGGDNIAKDVSGWNYSLEKLIENNPEIIICSDKNDMKNGIINSNGYKDLSAVKNENVMEIDNNLIDRQGPRLADGFYEMAKIIHPETFDDMQ